MPSGVVQGVPNCATVVTNTVRTIEAAVKCVKPLGKKKSHTVKPTLAFFQNLEETGLASQVAGKMMRRGRNRRIAQAGQEMWGRWQVAGPLWLVASL